MTAQILNGSDGSLIIVKARQLGMTELFNRQMIQFFKFQTIPIQHQNIDYEPDPDGEVTDTGFEWE